MACRGWRRSQWYAVAVARDATGGKRQGGVPAARKGAAGKGWRRWHGACDGLGGAASCRSGVVGWHADMGTGRAATRVACVGQRLGLVVGAAIGCPRLCGVGPSALF